MQSLKQLQPALDIEEQVRNLKNIGLIFLDEEKAKETLNDISYFRLVKAYSLNLKTKNSKYNDNITFEHLVELYLFNANFRQLLFSQIEKIEINVRCRTANYFSKKYGILGYKDEKNFKDQKFHQDFLKEINIEINRNLRSPFIKNFKENYVDGQIPFYALVEIFSFGTLSKFYKNMKNSDKKIIAKSFGVGYTYFESWIESLSYVRNICAHYGRLYNAKLIKTPKMYAQYNQIKNNRIFSVLLCMKNILDKDKNKWDLFVDELGLIIDKYEKIDLSVMGFPSDWERILRY